jgi:hypothetical protein
MQLPDLVVLALFYLVPIAIIVGVRTVSQYASELGPFGTASGGRPTSTLGA